MESRRLALRRTILKRRVRNWGAGPMIKSGGDAESSGDESGDDDENEEEEEHEGTKTRMKCGQ